MATSPRDFLAVATPGAGKTTFALTLATELIARGIVDKLTVVCPTEHLKGQWASSAARFGIHIDPDFTNAQGVAGSLRPDRARFPAGAHRARRPPPRR